MKDELQETFSLIISQNGKDKGTIEDEIRSHCNFIYASMWSEMSSTIRDEIKNNANDDGETVNLAMVVNICSRVHSLSYWSNKTEEHTKSLDDIVNDLNELLGDAYSIAEGFQDEIDSAVNDIGNRAAHLEAYGTQEEKDELISKLSMLESFEDLRSLNI